MFVKKILAVIIAAILIASFSLNAFAATPGFGNFIYTDSYAPGKFLDVRADDWFSGYVRDAYNFGFLRGRSDDTFQPGGLLTLGEAVTLAARLRSIYHTGRADFPESTPFYSVYANYAIEHGIIRSHGNYTAPVTRSQFATIMHNALPADAFLVRNTIPDFGIPDVASDTDAGKAVYALYRAGILSGSDRFGTFFPDSNISRAEASAVMVRLADPASRVNVQLPSGLPVELLFQRSTNAVFMIETFNEQGRSIRIGSGFFISEDGLGVTALHVFDNAVTAVATLHNGEEFPILGVRAFDENSNLVIFEVESNDNRRSYMTLADSDGLEVGASVYAIGSPRNLMNSISEGIVSRLMLDDPEAYVQFTAPISFGSGGGPVINTRGQAIGIASRSYTYGQNLNLAIPINLVKELIPGPLVTLEDLLEIRWEMLPEDEEDEVDDEDSENEEYDSEED